jgi:hypothetical protein
MFLGASAHRHCVLLNNKGNYRIGWSRSSALNLIFSRVVASNLGQDTGCPGWCFSCFLSPSRQKLGQYHDKATSASRYFPIQSPDHPTLINLCPGSLGKQGARKEGNLGQQFLTEEKDINGSEDYPGARAAREFAYKCNVCIRDRP